MVDFIICSVIGSILNRDSKNMEIEGFDSEPFDVVTFDQNSSIQIYSSYQ